MDLLLVMFSIAESLQGHPLHVSQIQSLNLAPRILPSNIPQAAMALMDLLHSNQISSNPIHRSQVNYPLNNSNNLEWRSSGKPPCMVLLTTLNHISTLDLIPRNSIPSSTRRSRTHHHQEGHFPVHMVYNTPMSRHLPSTHSILTR
jgi:hypothetical protein